MSEKAKIKDKPKKAQTNMGDLPSWLRAGQTLRTKHGLLSHTRTIVTSRIEATPNKEEGRKRGGADYVHGISEAEADRVIDRLFEQLGLKEIST